MTSVRILSAVAKSPLKILLEKEHAKKCKKWNTSFATIAGIMYLNTFLKVFDFKNIIVILI